MGQEIGVAKSVVMVRRVILRKRFIELLRLREQVRLAEIAAVDHMRQEDDRSSERPHAAN